MFGMREIGHESRVYPKDIRQYFTCRQVAVHFGVSADTVRRWIKEGRIKGANIGTVKRPTYRVLASEVREMMEVGRQSKQMAEARTRHF